MAEFKRKHISYSEFSSFSDGCTLRWKLDNIDGLRAKIYSIHMDFGTAVHGAVESYKRRKRPVPLEHAIKVFKKYFRLLFLKQSKHYRLRELEYDHKRFSSPMGFYLAAGENIIRRFDECAELADSEVVHNEYALYEPIDRTDGIDIKFKGFIDMVIKTKDKRGNTILYVCDFKTCGYGWDREKRQDRMLQYQIFLYKHFLCKKFGLDPGSVRTAFVLLKKRPPVNKVTGGTVCPVEFFPVSAGPVSVQRAVDALNTTITEMVTVVRQDRIGPNRKACINDFGDLCPHYDTKNCLGKDNTVEEQLVQLKKKGKTKAAPSSPPIAQVKTTEELRAKLFGKNA